MGVLVSARLNELFSDLFLLSLELYGINFE